MSFPQPKALKFQSNYFSLLFSLLTRKLMDPQSGQLAFLAKSTLTNHMVVYADANKQQPLLDCTRTVTIGFEWDVLDAEQQKKPLGHLKKNILKTMAQLGAESWDITDPSGGPLLLFERDASDSTGKRVMDEMLGAYYNPTHQYNISDRAGKPVAKLYAKAGWWSMNYDLVFEEKVGELERKMAVALFSAITLLLKK